MGFTRSAVLVFVLAYTMGASSFTYANDSDLGPRGRDKPSVNNLGDLELEDLAKLDVIVTSVSKKEENLSGAPAAIYVLTGEEIRRGGFTSLPDALRMVPGLTVAQLNAHAWIISARGFDTFPNEKMLVLIDGRSVYTPLYGGVNWDVQQIPLDEIDHVEVIRGPGGTLWGENAINGVINVITKNADQTLGGHASASYGQDEGYTTATRLGGKRGEHFLYRIYGSSSYWEPFVDSSGVPLKNNWDLVQLGTRVDWKVTPKDTLMFEMRGYDGHAEDIGKVTTPTSQSFVADSYPIRGGNVLGRWDHVFSSRSNTSMLAYCDWSDRGDIPSSAEYRDTCEIGVQHNLQLRQKHSLNWGGEFRSTADQTRSTFDTHFSPSDFRINLFSVFGQYEWTIAPNRLKIIAGSKLGHNPFTGFEIQPQIRAVWSPYKKHNVWGAVSRAVRLPTRNNIQNFRIVGSVPAANPVYLAFVGNPDLQPIRLKAYEFGYRFQPVQALSLDIATFYNDYEGIIVPVSGSLPPIVSTNPPYTILPMLFTNSSSAQTHGLEVTAKLQPWHPWILSVASTEVRGTSVSLANTPEHQFNIQSRLSLPHNFHLDSGLYHYNGVPGNSAFATPGLPTHNRIDTGFSWRSKGGLSLELVGQNLQRNHTQETVPGLLVFAASAQARRAVIGRINWDFSREQQPSN